MCPAGSGGGWQVSRAGQRRAEIGRWLQAARWGEEGLGDKDLSGPQSKWDRGTLPRPGILAWSCGDRVGHPPAQGFWRGLCYLHGQGKGVFRKPQAWDMGAVSCVCTSFPVTRSSSGPPPSAASSAGAKIDSPQLHHLYFHPSPLRYLPSFSFHQKLGG